MKAAGLYRKAAEHGLVTAQLELAHLYLSGKGVQRDYFEAARWFRLAAEQGNPIGENVSALCTFVVKASAAIIDKQPTGSRKRQSRTMRWRRVVWDSLPEWFGCSVELQRGLRVQSGFWYA